MLRAGRVLPALAVAAAAALTCVLLLGCGSSKSPLGAALSFFPKDAPVLVVVDTDTGGSQYKNIDAVGSKFPGWDSLKAQLEASLSQSDVDFNKDIKPWLGNEVVIGSTDPANIESDQVIVSMRVTDKDAFQEFIDSERKAGEVKQEDGEDGADLYSTGSGQNTLAVKGDDAILANSMADAKRALDTADGDDSFSEETLDHAMGNLPQTALARVYVDVPAVLRNSSDAAGYERARKIPWVAALGGAGFSFTVKSSELLVGMNLTTDRRDLSANQIPVSSGNGNMDLRGPTAALGALGIQNLAHTINFAEDAAKRIDPAGYGQFQLGKTAIAARTGVDLDHDLIDQLSGDTVITPNRRGVGVRVELRDPEGMKQSLESLKPLVPSFLQASGFEAGKVVERRAGSDSIYAVSDGRTTVTYAVLGDALVIATQGASLAQVADSPKHFESSSEPVAGQLDPSQLVVGLVAGGDLPPEAARILAPLEVIDGNLQANSKATTGELTVKLR